MSGRLLAAVSIAFIMFAIYSWYSTRMSNPEGFDINKQMYAEAEVYTSPVEAPIDRTVSSGGPAAPNQRPSRSQPATIAQEERPYDPQEEEQESASIPERLRHPERMFSPGLNNEDVDTAVTSGIASKVTGEANQVFGPEFAQNGGQFMGEITAHDPSLEMAYSSI